MHVIPGGWALLTEANLFLYNTCHFSAYNNNSDYAATQPFHTMKKSLELSLKISLSPEFSRSLAAKATSNLSDEEAVNQAAEIQEVLSAVMKSVQERYANGAKAEHEASEERQLIIDHGEELAAKLASATETLAPLDDETVDLLRRVIGSMELLVFPCMRFSETLSAREIVAYGKALAVEVESALHADESLTLTDEFLSDLRKLSDDDIFALREATDEYFVQLRIFELLEAYCKAIASRLKECGAKKAALEGLGLVQILQAQKSSWYGCLKEAEADEFVAGLKSMLDNYRQETAKMEARD